MSGRRISLALAFLVASCFFASSYASAQNAAGQTTTERTRKPPAVRPAQQAGAADVSAESADLSITATVTAKELRFEVVPNPTVEFPGKHDRQTIWDAERENLPRPVLPGVTYRDIGIRLKIVSRFADIDRIVAEALGEVPLTNEARPEEAEPSQPKTTPPAQTKPQQGGRPR